MEKKYLKLCLHFILSKIWNSTCRKTYELTNYQKKIRIEKIIYKYKIEPILLKLPAFRLFKHFLIIDGGRD